MSTQNFEQLMNLYGSIKIVCIIGAVLFLTAAVILFFVLKIPSVFGELTGRTAKKAIEEMIAEDNSGSLGASRKVGEDGLRRQSKITGILGTAKLRRKTAGSTGNLATGQLTERTAAPMGGGAAVHHDSYSMQDCGAKDGGVPETTVLNKKAGLGGFVLEKSIVVIHTDEVI